MRPSEALREKLEAVRATIARYPVTNPRVFGSVARGDDDEGSDLDLLVDPMPKTTYFHLVDLEAELGAMLGVAVDILTPGSLGDDIAGAVGRDSQPI